MSRLHFVFLGGIGTGFAASQLLNISRQHYKYPSSHAPSGQTSSKSKTTVSSHENSLDLAEVFGLPLVENDLIQRPAYTLQYSREKRNAIWVLEVIMNPSSNSSNGNTTKADRTKSHFVEDRSIPEMWRSKLAEYKNTGYDRGHLVPAADSSNQQNMNDTFYLTNVSPQVAIGFNRGYWAALERMIRSISHQADFEKLFVYTGPLFLPFKDEETGHYRVSYQVLSANNVPGTAVATHFYKVVLAKAKDKSHYLATFVVPNNTIDMKAPLEDFLVPLESVERAIGTKFFPEFNGSMQPLCEKVKCVVQDFKKKAIRNGRVDEEEQM